MFKIGDIVGWSGYWKEYWRVIRLDALGFEVLKISKMMSHERRFLVSPKMKEYYKYTDIHSFVIITKKQVQDELDTITEPYIEFIESMP